MDRSNGLGWRRLVQNRHCPGRSNQIQGSARNAAWWAPPEGQRAARLDRRGLGQKPAMQAGDRQTPAPRAGRGSEARSGLLNEAGRSCFELTGAGRAGGINNFGMNLPEWGSNPPK